MMEFSLFQNRVQNISFHGSKTGVFNPRLDATDLILHLAEIFVCIPSTTFYVENR
ncbi:MAG: hypothetical protein QW597_06280 [Thermoplasmataceae archaeon]